MASIHSQATPKKGVSVQILIDKANTSQDQEEKIWQTIIYYVFNPHPSDVVHGATLHRNECRMSASSMIMALDSFKNIAWDGPKRHRFSIRVKRRGDQRAEFDDDNSILHSVSY